MIFYDSTFISEILFIIWLEYNLEGQVTNSWHKWMLNQNISFWKCFFNKRIATTVSNKSFFVVAFQLLNISWGTYDFTTPSVAAEATSMKSWVNGWLEEILVENRKGEIRFLFPPAICQMTCNQVTRLHGRPLFILSVKNYLK